LAALDQYEASEKHSNGRNPFIASQQNYLELKLQALDQAYEELMPLEETDDSYEEQDKSGQIIEEGGKDISDVSFSKSLQEEARSVETRQMFWNDAATHAAVKSVRTEDPNSEIQTMAPQQHQRIPSEDELDTIDIYFRPSPGHSKSSNTRQPKLPDHPSDVSSCTWDGSSIFSIVSRTKQNIEEASVGGLSDVLGPIYNSSPGRSENTPPQQETKTATFTQSKDRRNQHLPPSGINSKQGSPKAQISPKSVTDFPASMQIDHHYDNISNFNTSEATVGQGKLMKGQRAASHHNSNEATEAARMGILRALSEDNSVCLPLDDGNGHNYLNLSNDTNANNSDKCQFMSKSTIERGSKARRFFQGKSDPMPKETNSLMASVHNEKQIDDQTSHQQSEEPKSMSSSTSSLRRKQNKGKLATSTPQAINHDGLLQSGEYSYDAILQSGMEFADELCMALNSCWKGDIGYSAVASAFDAVSSELENTRVREDESTHFTRSTFDDSTQHTRPSVGTGAEESASFNTMSSFSKRADSPNLNKNRKTSSPITATSSDPPPRMLV